MWASDGEPEEPEGIEGDDFVHKEKDFISLMSCTPGKISYICLCIEARLFYMKEFLSI